MMNLTVLIIAQDNEDIIAECIRSAKTLGHTLVIDGGSSDRTVEIAEALGAEVHHRTFRYTADQYNYGLSLISTSWAFILDSDERVTSNLRAELELLDVAESTAAFELPRLNYFLGAQIRHSGWWPDYNVRLIRPARCVYDDREVHARMVCNGRVGRLDSHIEHHTYKSVRQYVQKLNSYTTYEVDARQRAQVASDTRSRLRRLWLRTPGRATTRFLYMYVARRGFLDGRAGFDLAVLSAFYEFGAGMKSKHDLNSDKSGYEKRFNG